MTGADRADKKRKRATLFPQQQKAVRARDVERKRRVTAAKAEAEANAAALRASRLHQQDYWKMRLGEEFWAERAQDKSKVFMGQLHRYNCHVL